MKSSDLMEAGIYYYMVLEVLDLNSYLDIILFENYNNSHKM